MFLSSTFLDMVGHQVESMNNDTEDMKININGSFLKYKKERKKEKLNPKSLLPCLKYDFLGVSFSPLLSEDDNEEAELDLADGKLSAPKLLQILTSSHESQTALSTLASCMIFCQSGKC